MVDEAARLTLVSGFAGLAADWGLDPVHRWLLLFLYVFFSFPLLTIVCITQQEYTLLQKGPGGFHDSTRSISLSLSRPTPVTSSSSSIPPVA